MAATLYLGVSAISVALAGGVLWWRFRPAAPIVGVTKGGAATAASGAKSMAVASFSYLLSDYKPELVPKAEVKAEEKPAVPEKLAELPTQQQVEAENEATNLQVEEQQVLRREEQPTGAAAIEQVVELVTSAGTAPAQAPEPAALVEESAGTVPADSPAPKTVTAIAKIASDSPISEATGKPNDTHNRTVETKVASDRSKRKRAAQYAFSRSANPAVQTPVLA